MIKLKKETIHVNSMAITKADYDYANEILDLKFNDGKTYSYIGVSTNTFLSMKYSESIGKFINKHIIRSHKYSYVK
jgi:hypothetical protein